MNKIELQKTAEGYTVATVGNLALLKERHF